MTHTLPFPIWILLIAISSLTVVLLLVNPPTGSQSHSHSHSQEKHIPESWKYSAPEGFEGTWYPPTRTPIDDLESVLNGDGVFGLEYEDDDNSEKGEKRRKRKRDEGAEDAYAGWNWCNMPHVNPQTYVQPDGDYKLEYVEVV